MKLARTICFATCFSPLSALAQEAEPGGVYLTLDFLQSYESTTDRDLDTAAEEDTFDVVTTFDLTAVTETRVQRLAFDLDTDIRAGEGEVTTDTITTGLSYDRIGANASLSLSAAQTRADIASLRSPADFIDADGVLVLPDDFDDLTGTGTRQNTSVSAELSWGEVAPVGYRLSVGAAALRYEDASAALVDTDSSSVGAGLRLDLTEVLMATIDLSFGETTESGSPTEDSVSLIGALTIDRPLGALTARAVMVRDAAEDSFWGLELRRVYETPTRTFDFALGVAEDENRDAQVTGVIGFSMPRPASSISLRLRQDMAPGGDTVTTTLLAGYVQELSDVSSIRLGAAFAGSRDVNGDDPTTTGSLSASYGLALTDVWGLGIGTSYTVRESDGTSNDANTVFLTLERTVTWRR